MVKNGHNYITLQEAAAGLKVYIPTSNGPNCLISVKYLLSVGQVRPGGLP